MSVLLKLLPASAIRAAGRLQFRYPILRALLNRVGHALAGEGVIQRGAGKGLRFNARGCNPGFLAGTTEPLEQQMLLRYARPGAVVYDLGANAGYYAVIAARAVGSEGYVYAFEPAPKLAERIRENAALNQLTNVDVIEAAVHHSDGEVEFGMAGDLSVKNSIIAPKSVGRIRVKSIRLDTFAAAHRPPDLLLVVLDGALDRRDKPGQHFRRLRAEHRVRLPGEPQRKRQVHRRRRRARGRPLVRPATPGEVQRDATGRRT